MVSTCSIQQIAIESLWLFCCYKSNRKICRLDPSQAFNSQQQDFCHITVMSSMPKRVLCTQEALSKYLLNFLFLGLMIIFYMCWALTLTQALVECSYTQKVLFSSVTQSCPILCDPMNRSTPDLPVHYQLPEITQTQVHRVGDVIQPYHPLSSPSPPAPNPSQHQGLFQRVSSSHEVAKVLEFQLQHQSFQWTPRTDLL